MNLQAFSLPLRRGRIALAALLLAPVLALSAPAQTPASAEAAEPFRIVGLGDSVTAGYEPALKDGKTAPYGFMERLGQQALFHGRASVTNYGVLGLKSAGLANLAKAIEAGTPVLPDAIQPALPDPRVTAMFAAVPQMKADTEAADLIAITIGGNDMSVLLDIAQSADNANLAAKADLLIEGYSSQLGTAIRTLHSVNPDASFVVADQYQPVPKIAGQLLYDRLEGVMATFSAAADRTAAELQAEGIKIKIAHVSGQFVGKELFMTYIASKDIHPNQKGYEAMAQVFANAIWGEYRTITVPASGQPMNIVVSGKQLNTPYKPVLVKGRNFLAVQDIVNAVQATSKWDSKTRSVTIAYAGRTVVITMGATAVRVNGQQVPVESPAFLHRVGKEDKTYVPLGVLAEGLGFDVQYDARLRTVFINA